MEYVALLVPAMTLAALPLIDRLERWALSPDLWVTPVEPADADPLTSTGKRPGAEADDADTLAAETGR